MDNRGSPASCSADAEAMPALQAPVFCFPAVDTHDGGAVVASTGTTWLGHVMEHPEYIETMRERRRTTKSKASWDKPVIAVEYSKNAKIGEASATYVTQLSCPFCPFMFTICYAETGLVKYHTDRTNHWATYNMSATPEELARFEAAGIDGFTGEWDLRLHVVGDCRTNDAARIVSEAAGRHRAKHGKRVWTYTHASAVVERESWGDVSVLASCETPEQVRQAKARGYATAIVLPENLGKGKHNVDGETVVQCLYQTAHIPCVKCGLCLDDQNLIKHNITIGFAPDGDAKHAAKGSALICSLNQQLTPVNVA